MAKPVLTYFNGRGLAEVIRLTLKEAGVEFEDRRIEHKDVEALRATGALPYGQVPLYQEGDFSLGQSGSIARYVARKHGLHGKDARESAFVDSVVDCVLTDIGGNVFRQMKWGDEAKKAENKEKFEKEVLTKYLPALERQLAAHDGGKGYFLGEHVSLADIAFFHFFSNLQGEFPHALDKAPTLKALYDRVAARPKIAKWVAERPQTNF